MWYYKRKKIESLLDFPKNSIGFVYKITNLLDNRIYIGKKILYNKTKKRISKREKLETKTRKTYVYIVKESNWKTYTGSCKELNEDIKKYGVENFKFEILDTACTKKYMTFSEAKFQFKHNVLENDSYNNNILGKLFTRDTKNCNDE